MKFKITGIIIALVVIILCIIQMYYEVPDRHKITIYKDGFPILSYKGAEIITQDSTRLHLKLSNAEIYIISGNIEVKSEN